MQNDGGAAEFHNYDGFENGESNCQESLEDLCRSHLVTTIGLILYVGSTVVPIFSRPH